MKLSYCGYLCVRDFFLLVVLHQLVLRQRLVLAKDIPNEDDYGPISEEKRLIRRLMGAYQQMGRAGRPVRNSSAPVRVEFGLGLKQMDLDEKQKMLTMSMWTRYVWQDEYLVWAPDEYDGVAQLTIDPQDIWIPDIMLINTDKAFLYSDKDVHTVTRRFSAGTGRVDYHMADIDVPARNTMAVVSSNGIVNWYPHCIYHSACSVDVSNFPFDKQQCNLAFGSWTHPTKELDIEMSFAGGLDLSTFENENRASCAWEILNVTARRQVLPKETEYPNFAILTFEISLARKLVFSTYILTLPCVFLAFLTLVVFWLPPERPDRTALAMSTFSSFMVLLLILVEAAPPTANTIPILGVYYCINMVIIVMTVVLSTLVINLNRGPKDRKSRPPAWLSALALKGLARVFCMPSIYHEVARRSPARTTDTSDEYEERSRMIGWQRTNISNGCDYRKRSIAMKLDTDANSSMHEDMSQMNHFVMLKNEMEKTRKSMERLESCLSRRGEGKIIDDVMWEWRSVAMVIDRLFFYLYLVLIALSLALFFPRPKLDWET